MSQMRKLCAKLIIFFLFANIFSDIYKINNKKIDLFHNLILNFVSLHCELINSLCFHLLEHSIFPKQKTVLQTIKLTI